jgi:hypothetical protein
VADDTGQPKVAVACDEQEAARLEPSQSVTYIFMAGVLLVRDRCVSDAGITPQIRPWQKDFFVQKNVPAPVQAAVMTPRIWVRTERLV